MDDAGLGTSFALFRILQILTLIPCWAILASIVSLYNSKFIPAPGDILCLFVVAVLLTVWSFCILVTYLRAFNTAFMIVAIDVAGMIALIVGVALLSNEANAECVNVSIISGYGGYSNDNGLVSYLSDNSVTKVTGGSYGDYCGLLRGSWGLGIANIVFFFLTAIIGAQIANYTANEVILRESRHGKRTTLVEERIVNGRRQPEVVEIVKTTRRASGSGAHGKTHRVSKHDHRHGDRQTRRSSKTMTTQFYV